MLDIEKAGCRFSAACFFAVTGSLPAARCFLLAAERCTFRAGSRIGLAAATIHTDTVSSAFAVRIVYAVFRVTTNIQFLVRLIMAAGVLRSGFAFLLIGRTAGLLAATRAWAGDLNIGTAAAIVRIAGAGRHITFQFGHQKAPLDFKNKLSVLVSAKPSKLFKTLKNDSAIRRISPRP